MSPYLEELPVRLAQALSAEELELATRPGELPAATRVLHEAQLRIDTRLVPDPVPRVEVELEADARDLCAAWGLEKPVAVSGDVHQHTWSILVAGEELGDPHGRRIASRPFTAGRWHVVPRLGGRPAGELPGVSSGASPAYDVLECGGVVRSIEIAPIRPRAATLTPAHADAQALVAAMTAAYPAWQGSGEGWDVDPHATFMVLYDGAEPAAGAATIDGGEGIARASQICITGGLLFGAALLDVLEALAREGGFTRLRLDSTALLLSNELPYERFGFVVGPPYDGDADVEVWAEKSL
jgi:hypothetical protein